MRHSKRRHGKLGMSLAVLACGVALGLFVTLSGCDWCVYNRPNADFEVSEKPRPRVEVTFTNTSTDPNGFDDLREFYWEFGDGETADSMNATHVYKCADVYTVKLTVYDAADHADTCQKEVACVSPVFKEPELEDEAVGKGLYFNGDRTAVSWPYEYDEALQAWRVCYPKRQTPDGRWYIVAQNIVGLIPVRFEEDLSQPIVLEVSWELETPLKTYHYDYPPIHIRDPSQSTGVDAAWDLWQQGTKEKRQIVLPEGAYETRLEIREANTDDVFVWYFPFVVRWGC